MFYTRRQLGVHDQWNAKIVTLSDVPKVLLLVCVHKRVNERLWGWNLAAGQNKKIAHYLKLQFVIQLTRLDWLVGRLGTTLVTLIKCWLLYSEKRCRPAPAHPPSITCVVPWRAVHCGANTTVCIFLILILRVHLTSFALLPLVLERVKWREQKWDLVYRIKINFTY